MLRFSRLADYAVLLMTHMAQDAPDSVHNALGMAQATGVPVPTVSKILARLARKGLLGSTRGVKGGYHLSRPASGISVADIVTAMDGPVALTHCVRTGPVTACGVESLCPSRFSLNRINHAVSAALESVTLADLAQPPSFPPIAPRAEHEHAPAVAQT